MTGRVLSGGGSCSVFRIVLSFAPWLPTGAKTDVELNRKVKAKADKKSKHLHL